MKKLLLALWALVFVSTAQAQPQVGLHYNSLQSFNGYTAFSSYNGDTVYLIDNCGKLVHKWMCSERSLRNPVYILPNGDLVYAGKVSTDFASGAGLLAQIDWNSQPKWSFTIADSVEAAHHGYVAMPNGNILAVVWEKKSEADQIAAGRDPSSVAGELWSEKVVEITPGGGTPKIIWEWKLWDHLVQNFDPGQANYGDVRSHPELLDANLLPGYTGSWAHINSIDYNPVLDQILLCSRNFNELFIIDHSTTTAEAAGHTGGIQGKGGDFLYRWGNPANYQRGGSADQRLFRPHDGHWVAAGNPDAGKIIVFNNGDSRPGPKYSTVEIIEPPLLSDQSYQLVTDSAYLPKHPDWIYPKVPDTNFYSATQGSAQVLPNGNVLIAESNTGEFIEVERNGHIVWSYVCPVNPSGIITQGTATGDNSVFMIRRYAENYSGFTGRTLTPGDPIEINPLPYNCTIVKVDVDELEQSAFSWEAFPNPATDKIQIRIATPLQQPVNIALTDLSGRKVLKQQVDFSKSTTAELSVEGIAAGAYLLELEGKATKLRSKIIVQ